MLLRSASSPLLNSWKLHSKDISPENVMLHQTPKPRPFTFTLCASSTKSVPPPYPLIANSTSKMTRALSESDLCNIPIGRKNASTENLRGFYKIGVREFKGSSRTACLGLGRGLCCMEEGSGDRDCGGSGSGRGGGSNGGDDGCSGSSESNHENDKTDLYYKRMIETNPGNPLLLSNYARFLKEVRGDLLKAEEYYARAILGNPNDGDILSMYADLIWANHKDACRAESYFVRAVKASPDNSYVVASYARFLWDAEEEEDDEDEDGGVDFDSFNKPSSPNNVFGVHQPLPPLAAAS